MNRTGVIVIALIVCVLGGARPSVGQPAATPEGWVVLPVEEYRQLRERATAQPPTVPPPVEATLTRVDYELVIVGESIEGRASLTIDVLKEGWSRVQLPSGLMVREARIDGAPVPLVEGPPAHVLLSQPGRVVLTLDIVVPLKASAGTESLTIPPSAAPITRMTVALPRSGVELTINGGFVTEHAETEKESRWTAYGRPNQPMALSWKRRVDDRRAEQPLRIRARVTSVVGLGEDVSQFVAAVRVEVLQGLAREVTVTIPSGVTVNEVNGATVGDWQVAAGTLRVRLLDTTPSEASFEVNGDMRAARDGTIAVPLLRVPDAERETGGVAVEVAGAGEIRDHQPRGLEVADPAELGELVATRQSPSMVAFRLRPMTGTDVRMLSVTVVRYTPQAVLVANIEEARYRALVSDDGRLLVEARYAVRNNQRSFLKATLPAGSTLWTASVAGQPIRPGIAEQDAVLLPLQKNRANEEAPIFLVALVYVQDIPRWQGKGLAQLDLPALDLPISRTGLELHYSPRFSVALQPGVFRAAQDTGVFVQALRETPLAVRPDVQGDAKSERFQQLLDQFNAEARGRIAAGTLPVQVTFPAFGPSMFLATELTAEAQAATLTLSFRKAR
jgi:hypothetical protein